MDKIKITIIIGIFLSAILAGCINADNNSETIMLRDQVKAEQDTSSSLQAKMDITKAEQKIKKAKLTDKKK